MTPPTAQLNVRMDPQLKAMGDAALREIGFSPSEAVRALWARAARRGEDAALVKNLLEESSSGAILGGATMDEEASESERLGWNIVADGMAELRITLEPHDEQWPSDHDLLIQALEDRMQERGTA